MQWSERIAVDLEILIRKPVVCGTRLAGALIRERLAAGQSEQEILSSYPWLTREELLACLSWPSHLAQE